MNKVIGVLAAVIALSSTQASAVPLTLSASSGNLAASVKFDTSGTNLIVTLTNTSAADVLIPAEILTGVFFDLNNVPLTPVSAVLGTGSTVLFDPDGQPAGGVVGGEWAYASGLSGAPLGATEGISSSGLGLFGSPSFPGPDLHPPVAVNGGQYGITSAGDNPATGNTPVTGGEPLIKNQVVFTLDGLTAGFDPSAKGSITNVSFQYGTALTKPNVPWVPGTPVPEPSTILLLGTGLLCVGLFRRKK